MANTPRARVVLIAGDPSQQAFLHALGGEFDVEALSGRALSSALQRDPPEPPDGVVIVCTDHDEARAMHAQAITYGFALIVVSEVVDVELRRGCRGGPVELLEKPVGPGKLLRGVRAALKAKAAGSGAQVAVVDDDPNLRNLLKVALAERGHHVTLYEDGAEALIAIPQSKFDLVITDLSMPRLDGVSLCRALRASYTKDQLPIVVLSARSEEQEIFEALAAGANDYVVKPFAPPVLLAKLRVHLPQRVVLPPPASEELFSLEAQQFPRPFANYQLKAPIGAGGYGQVFSALDSQTGKLVAIKITRDDGIGTPADMARYFREVAALSLVDSRHVVKILAYGEHALHKFLVMELLSGDTAADLLRSEGPLPAARVITIAQGITDAIVALRDHNLLHRDVKLSNVFIREDGTAALIDLGLAKNAGDQTLTDFQTLLGTFEYTAPEVLSKGHSETTASDLYSLGVCLYELLSGVRPFEADTDFLLTRLVVSGEHKSLLEVRPQTPPAVAELVECLMEVEPGNRPSLEDLQAKLASLSS